MNIKLIHVIRIVAAIILISIFAQITIDVGNIPITGQTFAVLALALLLKPIDIFFAISIYLILGAAGIPVYADGASGFSKLTGGSGGFLFGFLMAGTIISHLFQKTNNKSFLSILSLTALGTAIILLVGNARLISMFGFENGLNYGFYPFWKGAVVKILVGSGIVYIVRRIMK